MGKYALILLLFVVSPLMAHDFTFTWQDPTQRTDGTALNPETEISGYRLRCEGPQNVERFVTREATNNVVGEEITAWFSGEVFTFDGVNDFVNTGFSVNQLANKSFTIESVVRYTGTAERSWTPIYGADSTVNRMFIGKRANNNDLSIWISGFGSYTINDSELFNGQEHKLVLMFDNSNKEFRVLINNVQRLLQTNVTGTFGPLESLLIGGVGHDVNQRWIGTARNVKVLMGATNNTRRYNWLNAVEEDGTYECRMTAIDTRENESEWGFANSPVVRVQVPAPPTDFRRIP